MHPPDGRAPTAAEIGDGGEPQVRQQPPGHGQVVAPHATVLPSRGEDQYRLRPTVPLL